MMDGKRLDIMCTARYISVALYSKSIHTCVLHLNEDVFTYIQCTCFALKNYSAIECVCI